MSSAVRVRINFLPDQIPITTDTGQHKILELVRQTKQVVVGC